MVALSRSVTNIFNVVSFLFSPFSFQPGRAVLVPCSARALLCCVTVHDSCPSLLYFSTPQIDLHPYNTLLCKVSALTGYIRYPYLATVFTFWPNSRGCEVTPTAPFALANRGAVF